MYPTVKLGSRGERFRLQARWVNDDWVEFPCKHSELIVISMEISHYNVYNFLRFGISSDLVSRSLPATASPKTTSDMNLLYKQFRNNVGLTFSEHLKFQVRQDWEMARFFSFSTSCLPLKAQIYSSMDEEGADDVNENIFSVTQQMDAKSFTTC